MKSRAALSVHGCTTFTPTSTKAKRLKQSQEPPVAYLEETSQALLGLKSWPLNIKYTICDGLHSVVVSGI